MLNPSESVRIEVKRKEEEAPGSCVYAFGDPTSRPTFRLEDAQLTYNGHVAVPGSTAAIDEGVEVTAKAYIRNTKATPDVASKAMLMLTRVLAGNEYVYKRSSAYACYEDHSVYFDVKFLMPQKTPKLDYVHIILIPGNVIKTSQIASI